MKEIVMEELIRKEMDNGKRLDNNLTEKEAHAILLQRAIDEAKQKGAIAFKERYKGSTNGNHETWSLGVTYFEIIAYYDSD